jgi:DNA polymerase (family 10)
MLDKFAVAGALREIGRLLEIQGENPFKVRAYETGARAVEELSEDLGALVASGRLTEVPGIGEALARKIADLHATGHVALLDRLRAEMPPGILRLLEVPDLGPRKIAALRAALGVGSLDELEAACVAGRVRTVKGFGERTERKILEGIRRLLARETRTPLGEALEVGEEILAHLRGSPAALRADLAGSARRFRETVGDLDLVAATRAPAVLAERFLAFPAIAEVIGRGDTKVSARLSNGIQVDLRMVPPEDYATLLHHLTGSKAHHVKLRGIARERGFTLSEWGLFRLPAGGVPAEAESDPGDKVEVREEEDLYRALGMQPVPPELREDAGEVEAALAGQIPEDLVRIEDVRGMVHCHTRWSDGRATVEEMARAAEAMGMEYLTITDHSRAAAYAGGLDADRLRRQWEEIERVQEKVKVRLLRGTEADILEDGALDIPDEVLERLDVIIASIHSRLKMSEAEMTRRIARAMRLPVFKILGHATGRLLGERDAYPLRMEEVLDAVAGSRAAVEVNGDPQRMDLEPRSIRLARQRGIRFALSSDAHSAAALRNLRFAVGTARRGWMRRGEVLNTLPVEEFRRAVRPAG